MPKAKLYHFSTHKTSSTGTSYLVYKVNEEYQPLDTYTVHETPQGGTFCTCFAGHKDCRHQKMLRLFKANQAIDKPVMYNFDKGTWLHQEPMDEEDQP